jgi:hypothetical protein
MAIDDATMVRHVDALLRDFVAENLKLFGFFDGLPAETALSKSGWRFFRGGHLGLRDDEPLPRLEFVGDIWGRGFARQQSQRFVEARFE